MLGQLQDAGNTTTLAHYLQLLGSSGLVMGLAKNYGARVRQRASSPKLLVLNTAHMTAQSGLSFEETRKSRELWGRLVESAVGAHLSTQPGERPSTCTIGWTATERWISYWSAVKNSSLSR